MASSRLAPISPLVSLARSFADVLHGRRVRVWLTIVSTVTVVGTLGYMVLLDWTFSDAVYMTIITLTTTGFSEVHPSLTWPERVWTMLLAVSAVAIIFGSLGVVAETIISDAASGRQEARRMSDAVGRLREHFVVCGYGRVGSTVIRELDHTGEQLVVVDVNEASLAAAKSDGHLVVFGDATDDDVLRAAGIERARGLVATMDSDAHNVYVTLSARSINPGLFIVARANTAGSEAKLQQAGANRVVSPYTMAGRRIAELAVRPRVVDFIDAALSHGNLSFSLEEVEVDEESSLRGVTVGSLRDEGIVTLAVLHANGDAEGYPPEDRALASGESLIVSGSTEALAGLRARA